MSKSTGVEIVISDGEVTVGTYNIGKMTIAENARQYNLISLIMENDTSLQIAEKNQKTVCARLVCVLKDGEGNYVYPAPIVGADGELPIDDSVDRCFGDGGMDWDTYELLASTNAEVNPVQSSLKAKKKKY